MTSGLSLHAMTYVYRYMHICYKCVYVCTYDEMSVCMNVSGRYFKCIITKFKQTLSAHLYTRTCMYVCTVHILQIVISNIHTLYSIVAHCMNACIYEATFSTDCIAFHILLLSSLYGDFEYDS